MRSTKNITEKIFERLENINPTDTSHETSKKQVFLSNKDSKTNLTQFAYGILEPGEECPEHIHPTMEEYFFFFKGNGSYQVGNETIEIRPNTFLRVLPNTKHFIKNTGVGNIEFVYYGVTCE